METKPSKVFGNIISMVVYAAGLSIACAVGGLISGPAMAATASISGVVKDSTGKPLRAARITATAGNRSVSRFTDHAGHYQIDNLKPASYDIAAGAWGFEQKHSKKELSGDVKMDFALAPQWDVNRLTSAEWISAFPEEEDFLKLQAACMRCHHLSYIIKHRGITAGQWVSKILAMGNRFVVPRMSKEKAEEIAVLLEKYFGPNSPVPAREQVHQVPVSDAVLKATVWEYTPPSESIVHSIKPDARGYVWFSEVNRGNGKLGRFEIATEQIKEFPMPSPWRTSSYPWVARDGRVWVTQSSSKSPEDQRLGEVDPETGKITEYSTPEGTSCGSAMADDSQGNIWCNTAGRVRIAKFDVKTKKFQYFEVPKPPKIHDIYYRTMWVPAPDLSKPWTKEETRAMSPIIHGFVVDSQDNVWYTLYDFGYIGRLDPKTGKSKLYEIPGAGRLKGVQVDENDNVWLGDFLNHTLVKVDPKTGNVETFQPPTRYAALYRAVPDGRGNLWISDFSGSQLTRFNMATKQFTEFPLPRPDVMVRFFGLDPQGRVWYGDTNGKFGALDPGDLPATGRQAGKMNAGLRK